MGLKDRVTKLEEKVWGGPEPTCESCGGKIVVYERLADGTPMYPYGDPCPDCFDKETGSPKRRGGEDRPDEPIRIIQVVYDPEDGEDEELRGTRTYP